MPAEDLATSYLIHAGFLALTAVGWLGPAVAAFAAYRGFKQRLDLYWSLAFLVLVAANAGEALITYRLSQEVTAIGVRESTILQTDAFYGVRLAALEMVAAFAIFYLFRARQMLTRPGS